MFLWFWRFDHSVLCCRVVKTHGWMTHELLPGSFIVNDFPLSLQHVYLDSKNIYSEDIVLHPLSYTADSELSLSYIPHS